MHRLWRDDSLEALTRHPAVGGSTRPGSWVVAPSPASARLACTYLPSRSQPTPSLTSSSGGGFCQFTRCIWQSCILYHKRTHARSRRLASFASCLVGPSHRPVYYLHHRQQYRHRRACRGAGNGNGNLCSLVSGRRQHRPLPPSVGPFVLCPPPTSRTPQLDSIPRRDSFNSTVGTLDRTLTLPRMSLPPVARTLDL